VFTVRNNLCEWFDRQKVKQLFDFDESKRKIHAK